MLVKRPAHIAVRAICCFITFLYVPLAYSEGKNEGNSRKILTITVIFVLRLKQNAMSLEHAVL